MCKPSIPHHLKLILLFFSLLLLPFLNGQFQKQKTKLVLQDKNHEVNETLKRNTIHSSYLGSTLYRQIKIHPYTKVTKLNKNQVYKSRAIFKGGHTFPSCIRHSI